MKKMTVINLTSKLLVMSGDIFCGHGCNDLFDDFWSGVSEEERRALYKEYHEWNGDSEEYNPADTDYLGDHALMSFFSVKIKEI